MKLCLGTVQLGMQYGIVEGVRPSEEDGIEILMNAYGKGIKTFDTSSAYGDSEKILNKFLNKLSTMQIDYSDIEIISKYYSNSQEPIDIALTNTLSRLGIINIHGYLLHSAKDAYNNLFVEQLIYQKKIGRVKKIGVSVYEPEDALFCAQQSWVDCIQVPYNVIDQRLHGIDFFELCKVNNKTIFARSALLQGLLLMPIIEVEKKLPIAVNTIANYKKLIKEYNYSAFEAAIEFVKYNDDIDYLVFGVDTAQQLNEFVQVFNKQCNVHDMIKELKQVFSQIDNDRIVRPDLWNIERKEQ